MQFELVSGVLSWHIFFANINNLYNIFQYLLYSVFYVDYDLYPNLDISSTLGDPRAWQSCVRFERGLCP